MADYPEIIEMLQSVMDAVDLSQEHTINYQEFLAATMARNTFIKENYIKLAFQKLDSDKSGYITYQNLVSIIGSEKHTREIIGEVDIKGDGQISYEEFRILMRDKHNVGHTLHHTGSKPSMHLGGGGGSGGGGAAAEQGDDDNAEEEILPFRFTEECGGICGSTHGRCINF